jgi:hypothetical protein
MAEYTIVLTKEQDEAGIYLLGSTEAVGRELQSICESTMGPWVLKYNADAAKATATAATELKSKYDSLDKAKKDTIDAILATAVQAPGNEEPLEDPTP